MNKTFKYYDLVLVAFVSLLLISNISAVKLVSLGPLIVDGGVVVFPLVYILGDILTEVYGFRYARRAIWTAFFILFFAVISFTIVRFLPVAPEYTDQLAFESILGFFPRIVLASLIAFLVGSFVNSFILAKIKLKTSGRYLSFRLIASTLVGQFIDTLVFALVAFAGVLVLKDLVIFILIGWVLKTLIEILVLPLTALTIKYLKNTESINTFDTKTNFNPFKFKV